MADASSPSSDPRRITHLLRAIGGDGEEHRAALAELMPLVYDNLRHMARRQLGRERRSYTLESAALVNEAFLKLAGEDALALQNRAHFFAVSANVMRHILVDHARARNASKRGGGQPALPLEDHEAEVMLPASEAERVLALDEALQRLAAVDEEASRIVEFRFFAGATEEEAARALGISPATARRRWAFARSWLKRDLDAGLEP
jgi:RNA polymerase sigma factor (TIGR02999 family)